MKWPAWTSTSLLRRIIISLTLANLGTIAIAVLWYTAEFESAAQDMRNSSLVSRAQTVADNLIMFDGTLIVTLPNSMTRAYGAPEGRHRYSVRDERGTILLASAATTRFPPISIRDGEQGTIYRYHDKGDDSSHMAGIARMVEIEGRRLVVQVEESDIRFQAVTRAMMENSLEQGSGFVLPLLFLPLIISIVVVRRSFRPVAALSEMAGTISPKTTGIRLPANGIPAEIVPLVVAVNSALDRLAEGMRVQRDFTAGAAHELRTPLAILGAHLDSLEDQTVKAGLRSDVDTMAHVVDQLLRTAQIEALSEPADTSVDLTGIAADVVTYLAPLAIRQGKAIALERPDHPVMINGHAQPVFLALSNLVGNALRYTGLGTTVAVAVHTGPDGPGITVRDHGPGVPACDRQKVFERFWRADRTTTGSGLGLYIVKRVAELHHGHVDISDAADGGAIFTLTFPPHLPPERPTAEPSVAR